MLKKLLLFILLAVFHTGCLDSKFSGYVGSSSDAGGGGPTAPSNLLVMIPTMSEVLFLEGSTTNVILQFSKPLPRNTVINWEIKDAVGEFSTLEGSVSALEASEQILIPLDAVADGLYEGDERFYLTLAGDANIFLSAVNVPLRIQEVDPQPVVSFVSASQTVQENVGSQTVNIQMSQAAAAPVVVEFTVGGTATGGNVDYRLSHSETITFNPGETSKSITVYVIDDPTAEPQEDILFDLTNIISGPATIDTANDHHAFYIEGSDGGTSFIILGAAGGTDSTVDAYLTNGNEVTAHWSNAAGESGYQVTIYQNNGVTVQCATQTTAADVTSYTFAGCTLTEGQTYKISVRAVISGVPTAPGNDLLAFTVDTIAPSAFQIVGVMGETDIAPDNYLAGTTKPTVVWLDATGESSYKVSIVSYTGGTTVCPEVTVPANITAYSFSACTLTQNEQYRIRVRALDSAGNTIVATNNDFDFLVTEVPAGYVIQGVTGGTADVTRDDFMDDGFDPVVHWDAASGVDNYDITILNPNGSIKCPTQNLPGNVTSTTFTNCKLDLHNEYRIQLIAYDTNGLTYPAANSPYVFRHRVGLYISGTGGSYYRGLPITSCGGVGGDVCTTANPYVVSIDLFENQIRVSNNGVLTGDGWTAGAVAIGNGLLKISADRIVLDGGGRISMDGKGYPSTGGPGAGASAAVSAGAAHGGNGTLTGVLTQAHAYGSVKLPVTMGSGGGANGANAGGAGGGVVDITVNESLEYASGGFYSDGRNGASGAGGGSGGSIKITTKSVSGVGGVIQANGGTGGAGGAGAGAGGRVALYYEEMKHSGGITGIGLNTRGGAAGAAPGTIFYKDDGDALGYLVSDSGTLAHTQGVEVPIPLTESFDQIYTRNQATFIIEAADTYTLQTSSLPFRLVVEGVLQLPGMGQHLTVATGGYFEWRRLDPVDDWSTITIESGGVLTHSYNTTAKTYFLDIQTQNLNVQGSIDVTGRGYQTQNSGGTAATGGYGGAYGGEGGSFTTGTAGAVYGNLRNPNDLGSGGGSATGGSGGGYVKITTDNLNITGAIRSNGNAGCGGGSGGTINIDVDTLTGFGATLAAAGGDGATGGTCGSAQGGAGSGGRVAIHYDNTTYPGGIPALKFETWGGDGNFDGAGGTVYHFRNGVDVNGHLIIINGIRDYEELITTPLTDANDYDTITTDYHGTMKIPLGSTFELPSDQVSYRMVMEGDFTLPGGSTHLQIKNGGYIEMRRSAPIVMNIVTIDQGGTLAHSANTNAKNYYVEVQANNMTVNGMITAKGKGYSATYGPGVPIHIRKGAGHGGYGGNGGLYTLQYGGPHYNNANLKTPEELGSGTLNDGSSRGASGGGYIRLNVAGTLEVNGTITVDGAIGNTVNSSTVSGGGSGGSIYITTGTISGGGALISADGGSGTVASGGSTQSSSGAGGRISIVYATDSYYEGIRSLINYERLRAFGGNQYSSHAGAAGSIFMYNTSTETNGKIYYNNGSNPHVQFAETPVPLSVTVDDFDTLNNATLLIESADTFALPSSVVDYRLVVAGTATIPGNNLIINDGGYFEWRKNTDLNLTSLTINYGGLMTHSYNYTSEAYTLRVNSGTFTMNSGGKVSVDSKGYKDASGPGYSGGAGAYGGRSREGTPYGSYNDPNHLGSGGYEASGGGLARFTVTGTTTLNGIISANGESDTNYPGSGGTIYINTDTLAGVTSTLRADGGNSTASSSAASGGRIAVICNTDNFGIPNMNITAYGGIGTPSGAAGTIFTKTAADTYGHLVINNLGREYNQAVATTLPNGENLDSVSVDQDAAIEIPQGESFTLPATTVNFRMVVGGDLYLPLGQDTLTIGPQGTIELRRPSATPTFGKPNFNNMVIQSGGTLTNTDNTTAKNYWVDLNLDNLDVYGSISVTGRGYTNETGPGAGYNNSGATHGGRGGYAGLFTSNYATPVYGLITAPAEMGSGGVGSYRWGGGGVIRIVVGNIFKLYGGLYSNGGTNSCSTAPCEGSAGGSIFVQTNEIQGSGGRIQAMGASTGFGGGGGRIAFHYTTDNYSGSLSSLAISARGGVGTDANGAAGTLLIKSSTDAVGHLTINNSTLPYKEGVDTIISENANFDSVTVGSETTGVYIPTGITFDLQNSDLNFPLRITGDPIFPSNNLTIKQTGKLYFDRSATLMLNDFTVEPLGYVSHRINGNPSVNDRVVSIQAANINLMSDSLIDVSSRGYPKVQGSGAGGNNTRGGGAGHGGAGGGSIGAYQVGTAGVTYGNATNPTTLGSGGGDGTTWNGGVGGGHVRLDATNTFNFEGVIKADGAASQTPETTSWNERVGGGGSGGSINLTASTLQGAFGSLSANGGNGYIYNATLGGGGGGGGRISVRATTDNYNLGMSSIMTSVTGGTAISDRVGQPGTVHLGTWP